MQDLAVLELSDDVKRGFVGDTPARKRKTLLDRTVALSVSSRSSPSFALDRFVEQTKDRHVRIDTESTAKKIGLEIYSNSMGMLSRERKRLKDLRLEDGHKSDGSEAGEIRNAITLYKDMLKEATASLSLIDTDSHNPTASISSIGSPAVPIADIDAAASTGKEYDLYADAEAYEYA